MYLNEAKDQQTKDDLALIIEEVLKQRIRGVKNEVGQWVTPSFPKLIYALQDDNTTPEGKYWYLTELAAKCSAKRLVPDYISEKKMIEMKGKCFPSMGCRSFLSPWNSVIVAEDEDLLDVIGQRQVTVNQLWDQLVERMNLVDPECIVPEHVHVNHKMVNGKFADHKVTKLYKKDGKIFADLESDLIFYGR